MTRSVPAERPEVARYVVAPVASFHPGEQRLVNLGGRRVAIFHTDAGHVTLHDTAYNAERHIGTGNPYKELIAGLMSRGLHVELCGATARIHHWGNEDLLPGIKVNADAGARMIQLVQQGFVNIAEE